MLETIVALAVVGLAIAALVVLFLFVLKIRTTPVDGQPEPGHGTLSEEELERLLDEGGRDGRPAAGDGADE